MSSPKPNRACLYHRVSTLDQDQTAARHELLAAATARGMTVAMEIEETGSGARNDRPGLQKIIAAARAGKINTVLVWKLDRFGRSALDLLANLRILDGCGVRFIAVTQAIDITPGGDAMSRLLVTMLAGVAEFERDLIRERTMLGIAKARREGRHLGRPRKLPAPSMEAVKQLRASGASWSTIATKLGCTIWSARESCERGLAEEPAPERASG